MQDVDALSSHRDDGLSSHTDIDSSMARKPGLAPRSERSISILGSTGSIGTSTLDLIARARGLSGTDANGTAASGNGTSGTGISGIGANGSYGAGYATDIYPIEALTAHSRVDTLIAQALQFRPALAVIGDATKYADLKAGLAGTGIEVAAGPSGLELAGRRPADWVMAGIVGAAGLKPTLLAVERGAVVALANKECLVCAGEIVMNATRQHGATLLPVDSEHNAIFQVFDAENLQSVESIILTASGGPFRTMDKAQMFSVTPEQAVAHPNWDMGAKISVDSATMMNKGLEFIEAAFLFPVSPDNIEILVHPQSVIHSMVRYSDGSVLAQLGTPDMRIPIAYALAWPERMPSPAQRLDLAQIASLTFEEPDLERFPALRLAQESLQIGGAAPTVLNAANEVAVAQFLNKKLAFGAIAQVVEQTIERVLGGQNQSCVETLEDVVHFDERARAHALELIARR